MIQGNESESERKSRVLAEMSKKKEKRAKKREREKERRAAAKEGDMDGAQSQGPKKKKESSLHYLEFFAALYNFCTLSDDMLIRYTFDLMDEVRSWERARATIARESESEV